MTFLLSFYFFFLLRTSVIHSFLFLFEAEILHAPTLLARFVAMENRRLPTPHQSTATTPSSMRGRFFFCRIMLYLLTLSGAPARWCPSGSLSLLSSPSHSHLCILPLNPSFLYRSSLHSPSPFYLSCRPRAACREPEVDPFPTFPRVPGISGLHTIVPRLLKMSVGLSNFLLLAPEPASQESFPDSPFFLFFPSSG